MSEIKSMDVITVINSISLGELKVKDVAVAYGKADRTIQKHIKSLGYVWDAKEKKYLPSGDGYSKENDNKLFSDFVESNSMQELGKKETRTSSTNKSTVKVFKEVDKDKVDSIDAILFGKSIDNDRVQRAYYLDKDIAKIIDNVDSKQKSNLVNACLRKVFEEKGLL